MENRYKGFAPFTVALVVVVVAGAGLFFYFIKNGGLNNEPINIQKSTQQAVTDKPVSKMSQDPLTETKSDQLKIANSADISNWQVYKNDAYQFEIKFPKLADYLFNINNRDLPSSEAESKNIQFTYKSKDSDYMSIYIQELTSDVKDNIIKVASESAEQEIAGYAVTTYLVPAGGDALGELGDFGSTVVIIFKENPNFFVRVAPNDAVSLDEFFSPIISTFKFIE